MPVVKPTASGYEGVEVPDGLYVLTCKNVIEVTIEGDLFGRPNKYRLELHGVTPEGEPFTVDPLMNKVWSALPGKTPSTLFKYADALGCDPDPNEAFDTDDMIGKKLEAFIQTEEAPGSWPRIMTYGRVKGKGKGPALPAPAPSQKATEASPAVLQADGTVEWTAFWTATKRMGMTRESVIEAWGGDVQVLLQADAVDVAAWLLDITEKVSA